VSAADRPRVLVGLDGGATAAKACRVERCEAGLRTHGVPVEVVHAQRAGFEPVARAQAGARSLPAAERERGRAWVAAAARAVLGAAGTGGGVLLGVAMPGIKTADRRGIAWARNGPRIPDLLAQLEQELAAAGCALVAPAAGLYSDGDCCGWGERHAVGGLFRGVRNAWYVGGGTGLAEALLLAGEPLELDTLAGRVDKAWQLPWRDGASFEDVLSLRGLNARAGGAVEQLVDTSGGREALEAAALALAELAARRAREVAALGRGPLERFVVGQRLGLLLADGRLEPLRAALEPALAGQGLPGEGWLVPSRQREAPALGAAARALAAWERAHG
jgi:hypothetical protein